MSLIEIILTNYPELISDDFISKIVIQDDADGKGSYVVSWNYEKPLPKGLKIGK